MKTKTCTKCGTVYKEPLEKWFYKTARTKNKLWSSCKECWKKYAKQRNKNGYNAKARKKHYEKLKTTEEGRAKISKQYRKSHLWVDYRMRPEDYDKMFEQQNGCCAICGIHQSELTKRLCVDHNHKTGQIRALLCSGCNQKLAAIENKGFKIAAEEYLSRYEESHAE
jgi:hypothetical protein